jgi:hypothetical protein
MTGTSVNNGVFEVATQPMDASDGPGVFRTMSSLVGMTKESQKKQVKNS